MAFIEREKKGFFGRLSERISDVIMMRPKIDEEMLDSLVSRELFNRDYTTFE